LGRSILFVTLLVLATGFLYFWRLDDTPTLTRDEAFVSLSAHSIATTGHDLERRHWPLYFRSSIDQTWWSPILPYVIAPSLKVVPLSERVVRTPMALAAVLNVVLVFLIGRLVFEHDGLAFASAVLLALSPVQLIENRYANDPGVPATFALVWALATLVYLRRDHARALFGAGVALGVGCFSYLGALLLMPLYLLLTAVVMWQRHDRWTRYLLLLVGFVIPVALGLPWVVQHPDFVRSSFLHYQSDPRVVDTTTAFRLLTSFQRVIEMGTLYVDFWDPRFLFIRGSDVLRHSTGHVGVYLVTMAGLMAIGLVRSLHRSLSEPRLLIIAGGLLLAPVPSCVVDFRDHLARQAIWRADEIMAFGALVAGVGLEYLCADTQTRWRRLAWWVALGVPIGLVVLSGTVFPHRLALLLDLIVPSALGIGLSVHTRNRWRPMRFVTTGVLAALSIVSFLQFGDFYREYLTTFRTRSMVETDGNIGGLLETVISLSPPTQVGWIYLGFRLGPADWGGNYWRFYVHKHRREDLLIRSVNDQDASRFNHAEICRMPPRSLLTTRVGWDAATDSLIDRMIAHGELVRAGSVGWPVYVLLWKTEECMADS
jgi:4-amino-4-deoxy-L-arabinose transferase-like glycosyltransferase